MKTNTFLHSKLFFFKTKKAFNLNHVIKRTLDENDLFSKLWIFIQDYYSFGEFVT